MFQVTIPRARARVLVGALRRNPPTTTTDAISTATIATGNGGAANCDCTDDDDDRVEEVAIFLGSFHFGVI